MHTYVVKKKMHGNDKTTGQNSGYLRWKCSSSKQLALGRVVDGEGCRGCMHGVFNWICYALCTLRGGYTIVYHILCIFCIPEILNTLNKCLKERTGK